MANAGAPARRPVRWVATAVVVALLVTGAAVAGVMSLRARYAVPTADLFGSAPAAAPLVAGSSAPTSAPPTVAPPGVGITGPLNILLVGVDTRGDIPDWQPHADAVLLLHVPAGLDRGYLFSLPRDLLVDVPAFRPARFGGGRMKLTEAMSRGSRVSGTSRPDPTRGFQLVAATVSGYTGIKRFDAGAVLTFAGLQRLVDALGGVDLHVDQRVASLHKRPDGRSRPPGAGPGGYAGPQMVYERGRRHFTGWQALDYARQRYIPGGDYSRQRHQRQLIKAIVAKAAASDLAGDPVRLAAVLRALGGTLIFDGRGHDQIDFAYALRGLRPRAVTLVALPGGSVGSGANYRGEQLRPVGGQFLGALRAGRVDAFLRQHPELVHG